MQVALALSHLCQKGPKQSKGFHTMENNPTRKQFELLFLGQPELLVSRAKC
jgi:hypothetical protein